MALFQARAATKAKLVVISLCNSLAEKEISKMIKLETIIHSFNFQNGVLVK